MPQNNVTASFLGPRFQELSIDIFDSFGFVEGSLRVSNLDPAHVRCLEGYSPKTGMEVLRAGLHQMERVWQEFEDADGVEFVAHGVFRFVQARAKTQEVG